MATSPKFYLLHGDDDLSVEEAFKKIRAQMGTDSNAEMNTSEYEGDSVSVAKVLNDVRSFPFLSDKRLVIVKGFVTALMKTASGKDELEKLIEAIPNLPNHARLVLVERDKLRSDLRIVKLAQKEGYCQEFASPKDSTDWIRQRAKTAYQTEIEMPAAMALASVIGNDLRRADNELIKLVSYIDENRPITEADVAILTPYVADANVFEMVDALAIGDGNKALTLLTTSLDQDPSDPGFRLFSLIVRQFRLLLLVRDHLERGGSANNNDIAKVLGIHAYPAGKVAVQSRRFTIENLEKIYRTLQQNDIDMKTGKIQPRLALEMLVASLAKK